MKRRCEWCGASFQWEGVGRPPKYCRRSHRQRHYEARREAQRLGIGGVLLADDAWQHLRDAAYVLESAIDDALADIADGDPEAATRGLVDAARSMVGAIPEPVATSG